jgi:phosphoglycerol transferase MdoB-like AlkP superfamily enzyme
MQVGKIVRIIKFSIKLVYIVLIISPLLYLAVASYSYFSVINTFGRVPVSNDYTYDLVKSTGKQFKIFPIKAGEIIMTVYFFSIFVTPIYVFFMLLLKWGNTSLPSFKWYIVTLLVTQICVIILLVKTEFASWYSSYVLD